MANPWALTHPASSLSEIVVAGLHKLQQSVNPFAARSLGPRRPTFSKHGAQPKQKRKHLQPPTLNMKSLQLSKRDSSGTKKAGTSSLSKKPLPPAPSTRIFPSRGWHGKAARCRPSLGDPATAAREHPGRSTVRPLRSWRGEAIRLLRIQGIQISKSRLRRLGYVPLSAVLFRKAAEIGATMQRRV